MTKRPMQRLQADGRQMAAGPGWLSMTPDYNRVPGSIPGQKFCRESHSHGMGSREKQKFLGATPIPIPIPIPIPASGSQKDRWQLGLAEVPTVSLRFLIFVEDWLGRCCSRNTSRFRGNRGCERRGKSARRRRSLPTRRADASRQRRHGIRRRLGRRCSAAPAWRAGQDSRSTWACSRAPVRSAR